MAQKKSFISTFVVFVAIFGLAQFASAGVVQYTSEQDILLTGPNITLKIESGSQADSVAVDATTVTVTTGASDTFVIRSDNRYLLTNNQNVHVACTSSYSKSTFSGAWVVTYTPSTTTCTIPTSTGGGGGGGGYVAPTPVSATATSISINSGAATATSRTVTLTLLASNASQMKICNTSDFVGCAFETYSTTKQWTLTEGDGAKTVYAKFASSTGGESSTISDAITLALPVVPVPVVEPVVEPTVEPTVEPKKEEVKVQTREQIIASLQLQIAELIKKLQELQAKKAVQDGLPLAPSGVGFEKNLRYGMRNDADVTKLQELLTREGVYSGPITGNFFALTRGGVIKFQEKYADEILKPFELTKGNGFVGAKTREKLNALMK